MPAASQPGRIRVATATARSIACRLLSSSCIPRAAAASSRVNSSCVDTLEA